MAKPNRKTAALGLRMGVTPRVAKSMPKVAPAKPVANPTIRTEGAS